jgi:transposase InsO family protein
MAEAFNSLFRAELARDKGPWRGLYDLEKATVEYIGWYNNRRVHGELEPSHCMVLLVDRASVLLPLFVAPDRHGIGRRSRRRSPGSVRAQFSGAPQRCCSRPGPGWQPGAR